MPLFVCLRACWSFLLSLGQWGDSPHRFHFTGLLKYQFFSVCGVLDDWGLCLVSWDRGRYKDEKNTVLESCFVFV